MYIRKSLNLKTYLIQLVHKFTQPSEQEIKPILNVVTFRKLYFWIQRAEKSSHAFYHEFRYLIWSNLSYV